MDRQELDFFKKNGYYKFPNILQIEITRSCPLKCKQCYKIDNQNLHMEYNNLCRLLDLVDGKCGAISLNGGEPLIYPYILSLLAKVSSMKFNVYLYTSGYGISEDICHIIKSSNNIHFYIPSTSILAGAIRLKSQNMYMFALLAGFIPNSG